MNSRKLTLLVFVFPLLLISIYSHSNPEIQKLNGDTVIIGDYVEPTIINPILTHSSISAMLKTIIFDGLIKLDEKMESVPHLALSWESSPDGRTWIFNLRREVKFHDGVELTAEDVRFTFDKILDPSINSPYITTFKSFKAVNVKDRYTVEIELKNPSPSLPFYLDVGILPKHLLVGKDLIKAEFNYHPIGTGPFKIESWSRDEIILKANEHYFEGRPYLNRVIAKSFKDQRVSWAELMRGTVDCVFLASSKNYGVIDGIPEFKVYSFLVPYYDIWTLNESNISLFQKEVRRALNYAVDKKSIITRVLRGKGQVSVGTIFPQSWAYNKAIEPYPYDPKKAAKLLENAGWMDTNGNHILDKDGKEFEFVLLIVDGDDVARGCALQIQQQLLDIGIRMKVKPLPFQTMYERYLSAKKFEACLLTILSDTPDRNYAWWHSSQIKNGFNVFSYRNERIDELLEKGRVTLDKEERKKIYYRFQREIYEDPPGVFLFWREYLIGIHKRFKGVKVSPAGIFSNIHEWYVPREEQKYR